MKKNIILNVPNGTLTTETLPPTITFEQADKGILDSIKIPDDIKKLLREFVRKTGLRYMNPAQ
jgi:hypothetical protein